MWKLALVLAVGGLFWGLSAPGLVIGTLHGLLVQVSASVIYPGLGGVLVLGLLMSASFRRLTWGLLRFLVLTVIFLLLFGWLFSGRSSEDDDVAVAALLLD